jgi:hypothetical protein
MDRERLRRVWLVHGDLERAQKLEAALEAEGYDDIAIPERGETVEL